MTERSVTHATFVIERRYAAAPSRVFAAWADPSAKARWFSAPDEGTSEYRIDFRVGGSEYSAGRAPNGKAYTFDARYQDVIPGERIVYTYDMTIDGVRISVSLSTVDLRADGAGTRLIYTEQGVYLDGLDDAAERERGTQYLFDALGREVESG